MRTPANRLISSAFVTLLLLFMLSSCEEILSTEEPPCLLLSADFSRVDGQHRVSLKLRPRQGTLPDGGSARFILHASVPLNDGETGKLTATLQGSEEIVRLPGGAGVLLFTFDTPFSFLPREPMELSDLTLRSLVRNGTTIWSGKLLYPYVLTESLVSPGQ